MPPIPLLKATSVLPICAMKLPDNLPGFVTSMSVGLNFAACTGLRTNGRISSFASFAKYNSFLSMCLEVCGPWLFLSTVSVKDKSRTKGRKDKNQSRGLTYHNYAHQCHIKWTWMRSFTDLFNIGCVIIGVPPVEDNSGSYWGWE